MAESSCPPLCLVQCCDFDESRLLVFGYDHLRYAFAVVDDEGFGGEVDEDDANLASIVGIDGAGRVEHGDALLQSES